MRISLLIYSMSGGGAERVVSYLLPYLEEKGHSVHLVLMNASISFDLPEGIPIHFIERSKANENGFMKLMKLPILAIKYAKLLNRLKIHQSFSLLTRPSYINILAKLFSSHSFVSSISERSYPSFQYGYGNWQSRINNYLIKKLYPKADLIISNSYGNAEDLIANYNIDPGLLNVIHNPIDINYIKTIAPKINFFKREYFNLLTVGRLDVGKNHELLIKSIADKPKVKLYILGKGPLEYYLKELSESMNISHRVVFLGFDKNPYKYMKAADLFVFGSNHEGFPNVLLEAMCCGLPILTTNCKSGPSEILQLKEPFYGDIMKTDYGILSPVGNIELMKKGLDYFIEHPEYRKTCRKNAFLRIKDFEKNKILSIYEKTLSK